MINTPQRIFAVTCVVPRDTGERLRVQIDGRTVTLAAPDGFERTFNLPRGTATPALQWQVYGDVFELRAPYRNEADEAMTATGRPSPRIAAQPAHQ